MTPDGPLTPDLSRDIASWRREYSDRGLADTDLPDDPISAFVEWLSAAHGVGLHEPNAVVLSTVSPESTPSSRLVLLKTVDARGFVFYTNLQSRKGDELLANPACALLFPWYPLERQIRIEGVATTVDEVEADAYFAGRPRGSQLGAWASPQSEVVPDLDFLSSRYESVSDRFASSDVIP
ncbi:MAG: pyridoxamine 5'-phosphate oxidase, partial [Nocardioidaceae bacterium]|nr:pyridoxamine 5'-phosphate oxidase [Nocardioidaceae bacterium]